MNVYGATVIIAGNGLDKLSSNLRRRRFKPAVLCLKILFVAVVVGVNAYTLKSLSSTQKQRKIIWKDLHCLIQASL